jgi:hypothetical protein
MGVPFPPDLFSRGSVPERGQGKECDRFGSAIPKRFRPPALGREGRAIQDAGLRSCLAVSMQLEVEPALTPALGEPFGRAGSNHGLGEFLRSWESLTLSWGPRGEGRGEGELQVRRLI